MSNFTFSPTDIPGVQIVDVKSFGDARGYFMETYRAADFAAAGITDAVSYTHLTLPTNSRV